MLRKLRIQTQLIILLVSALILLTAGLELLRVLQERAALVQANRSAAVR
jgi:hypothetical protein